MAIIYVRLVKVDSSPISPNESNYLIWRIDKLKAELNVLPPAKSQGKTKTYD